MTGPDDQGSTKLLLHSGGEEEYALSTGNPLGHLLVSMNSVFKDNEESRQHSSGWLGAQTGQVGMGNPI